MSEKKMSELVVGEIYIVLGKEGEEGRTERYTGELHELEAYLRHARETGWATAKQAFETWRARERIVYLKALFDLEFDHAPEHIDLSQAPYTVPCTSCPARACAPCHAKPETPSFVLKKSEPGAPTSFPSRRPRLDDPTTEEEPHSERWAEWKTSYGRRVRIKGGR